MITEFQDYFAEVKNNRRAVFSLDDTYDGDENRYCPYCELKIFGVPTDVEEHIAEQILAGQAEGAVHIATLTGFFILNSALLRKGWSSVQMADDHSYLLGYAMKALTEEGTPLSGDIELEFCTSLFYIYDFIFEEKYRDSEFITEMIKKMPSLLLYTSNAYLDMLVYYPSPLPYEKDVVTRVKEGFAKLAAKEVRERLAKELNGEYVDGSRNVGDTYPVSAIDRPEWELCESAGFSEVGNSRLLYACVDKMLNIVCPHYPIYGTMGGNL